MNKYEALLRYLSKVKGSISYSTGHNNQNIVTIKINDVIKVVVNSTKEVLIFFDKEIKGMSKN